MTELFEGHPILQWMWRYTPVLLVFVFIFAGFFMSLALSVAGLLVNSDNKRGAP